MSLFSKRVQKPPEWDLTQVQINPFSKEHVLNRFECGAKPLDSFIKHKAEKHEKRLEHRVMVATLDGSPNCIGYYALQIGSDAIPDSFKTGNQSYITNYTSFPAIHLTHLAVSGGYQGCGLGQFLLQDVFEVVAEISQLVGFYALTLQSYDAASTKFYEKQGFVTYAEGGGQPKMLYPIRSIVQLVTGE